MAAKNSSKLSGQTFVVTGTLEGYSRAEAKKEIEALGGKVTGSVSSNTDCVVVGADAGSKADKAKQFGIPIFSEAVFKGLIGGAAKKATKKKTATKKKVAKKVTKKVVKKATTRKGAKNKITKAQVKSVRVIYDCSEFSRDTYKVKGYSATFQAERWDDNRYLADYVRLSDAVADIVQHRSEKDVDLIKDLVCGQSESYTLLEGEGSSEECGSDDDDESYEALQEKLEGEGENLDDAWFDEHAKRVESVRQILEPYPKKLEVELIDGSSKVIDGYDAVMSFTKTV